MNVTHSVRSGAWRVPDTTSQHYSDHLGTLGTEQLQEALSRFELGTLCHSEPITSGLFGQNLFLSSTTGDYVLRGKPRSPRQLPRERFFARQLHEKTDVPVPWPYLHDTSTDIFGWSYVIMPRMPGVQTQDPDVRAGLSRADRQGIAHAVGAMAARMHDLEWPCFGEYDLGTDTITADDADALHRAIHQVRDKLAQACQFNEQTTPDDVAWVEHLIRQAEEGDTDPGPPTYVHHDYREGNVVLEYHASEWQVAGVFDFHEGYFGDAEEDLPRPISSYIYSDELELVRHFLTGYWHRRQPRPGLLDRYPVYVLNDCLTIWCHGLYHGWFESSRTLQDYATRYVSTDVVAIMLEDY